MVNWVIMSCVSIIYMEQKMEKSIREKLIVYSEQELQSLRNWQKILLLKADEIDVLRRQFQLESENFQDENSKEIADEFINSLDQSSYFINSGISDSCIEFHKTQREWDEYDEEEKENELDWLEELKHQKSELNAIRR